MKGDAQRAHERKQIQRVLGQRTKELRAVVKRAAKLEDENAHMRDTFRRIALTAGTIDNFLPSWIARLLRVREPWLYDAEDADAAG